MPAKKPTATKPATDAASKKPGAPAPLKKGKIKPLKPTTKTK